MVASFERKETTLTAKPEGRLDSVSSPEFLQQILQELDGVTAVTIDLEKVDYVSSGGLRALLRTQQEMEDRDGAMKVIHVSAPILKIFEIVGFLDVLTLE